jgi:GPH family glycoside/pentoside/hexuronide:cation symporter
VQPESAIQMIIDLYEIGPIFVWVAIIIVLVLYRLDKIYPQIMKDLVAREAKGEL